MKRLAGSIVVALLISAPLVAQTDPAVIDSPEAFRSMVSIGTSLADVSRATGDMDRLQELAERVLILDGTAASITVYSTDPNDFYVEMELVGGSWDGLSEISMHTAFVILDNPEFANRVAERVPRDPPPELILRNDRVLVAGRLISIAEDPNGALVPVIQAYDLRPLD